METLKNKLVTIEDVLKIGEMLSNRMTYLKVQSDMSVKENEEKDYGEQFYKTYMSYGTLKFTIMYPDTKEERDSFAWFKSTLIRNPEKVSGITIYYDSICYHNTKTKFSQDEYKEHFRLSIDCSMSRNYCDLDVKYSENNDEFIKISRDINEIFNNCPPRFDKTLKNKVLYRLTPSFAISVFIALIAMVALFALTKLNILPQDISTFITKNPFVLVAGGALVTILLGVIIPNPNMSLFNQLKIDQKYKSYDTNWKIEHYENDYERYEDQVEFAVGKFYGSDKVRQKIQKNFKTSLTVLCIGATLFVALAVLMFII